MRCGEVTHSLPQQRESQITSEDQTSSNHVQSETQNVLDSLYSYK